MKALSHNSKRGFTLIELLVVIAIIAILAGLLLPVLARGKVKAQEQRAKMEAGSIENAIHTYVADFSRYPASSAAVNAAAATKGGYPEDFTFGTFGLGKIKTPNGVGADVLAVEGAGGSSPTPLTYQTNNSEVMAILLDMTNYPYNATLPTVNAGHVKNPQRNKYLSARMASDTTQPGIGPDLVYRDPWSQPYMITLDLNADDKARDGFYRWQNISQGASGPPAPGLNGLNPAQLPGSGPYVYEASAPVMVWSAGPDKMIDNSGLANAISGANKDNILSWKP